MAAEKTHQRLRLDVIFDLHNPTPDDPTFFYILPPEMLKKPLIGMRDRFIQLPTGASARSSR